MAAAAAPRSAGRRRDGTGRDGSGVGRPRAAVGALAGEGRRAPPSDDVSRPPSGTATPPAGAAEPPFQRHFPKGIKVLRGAPPLPFWGYSARPPHCVFFPNSAMLYVVSVRSVLARCPSGGVAAALLEADSVTPSPQLPYCFLRVARGN